MPDVLAKQREFVQIADLALKLREVEGDWETKFNLVFNVFKPALTDTGVAVEWHDPDMGYEDDARAYLAGVQAEYDKLKPILESLGQI